MPRLSSFPESCPVIASVSTLLRTAPANAAPAPEVRSLICSARLTDSRDGATTADAPLRTEVSDEPLSVQLSHHAVQILPGHQQRSGGSEIPVFRTRLSDPPDDLLRRKMFLSQQDQHVVSQEFPDVGPASWSQFCPLHLLSRPSGKTERNFSGTSLCGSQRVTPRCQLLYGLLGHLPPLRACIGSLDREDNVTVPGSGVEGFTQCAKDILAFTADT